MTPSFPTSKMFSPYWRTMVGSTEYNRHVEEAIMKTMGKFQYEELFKGEYFPCLKVDEIVTAVFHAKDKYTWQQKVPTYGTNRLGIHCAADYTVSIDAHTGKRYYNPSRVFWWGHLEGEFPFGTLCLADREKVEIIINALDAFRPPESILYPRIQNTSTMIRMDLIGLCPVSNTVFLLYRKRQEEYECLFRKIPEQLASLMLSFMENSELGFQKMIPSFDFRKQKCFERANEENEIIHYELDEQGLNSIDVDSF